jgi:hypothetical protein
MCFFTKAAYPSLFISMNPGWCCGCCRAFNGSGILFATGSPLRSNLLSESSTEFWVTLAFLDALDMAFFIISAAALRSSPADSSPVDSTRGARFMPEVPLTVALPGLGAADPRLVPDTETLPGCIATGRGGPEGGSPPSSTSLSSERTDVPPAAEDTEVPSTVPIGSGWADEELAMRRAATCTAATAAATCVPCRISGFRVGLRDPRAWGAGMAVWHR